MDCLFFYRLLIYLNTSICDKRRENLGDKKNGYDTGSISYSEKKTYDTNGYTGYRIGNSTTRKCLLHFNTGAAYERKIVDSLDNEHNKDKHIYT